MNRTWGSAAQRGENPQSRVRATRPGRGDTTGKAPARNRPKSTGRNFPGDLGVYAVEIWRRPYQARTGGCPRTRPLEQRCSPDPARFRAARGGRGAAPRKAFIALSGRADPPMPPRTWPCRRQRIILCLCYRWLPLVPRRKSPPSQTCACGQLPSWSAAMAAQRNGHLQVLPPWRRHRRQRGPTRKGGRMRCAFPTAAPARPGALGYPPAAARSLRSSRARSSWTQQPGLPRKRSPASPNPQIASAGGEAARRRGSKGKAARDLRAARFARQPAAVSGAMQGGTPASCCWG